MYVYQYGRPFEPHRDDYSHVLGKVLIIIIGILIGASVGLWAAIETMPLPTTTTVYIPRR